MQHWLWFLRKFQFSKLNLLYIIYLSSFKGFTSKVKNKFIGTKQQKIFLDGLILKYSKNITSIDIIHQKRFEGDGNYSAKKLFTLWFDMIENFHFFPLRFGSFIGTISFLIRFSFAPIRLSGCSNWANASVRNEMLLQISSL